MEKIKKKNELVVEYRIGQCTYSEDHGLCPLKGIKGINQMYQGLIILASVTLFDLDLINSYVYFVWNLPIHQLWNWSKEFCRIQVFNLYFTMCTCMGKVWEGGRLAICFIFEYCYNILYHHHRYYATKRPPFSYHCNEILTR